MKDTESEFDQWAAQLRNTQALKDFGNHEHPPFIGVHAKHFLEQVYREVSTEPVDAGLGGFPNTFDLEVSKAIDKIEGFGCKLFFVFDGLQTNFDEPDPEFDNSISDKIAGAFKEWESIKGGEGVDQTKDLEQAKGLFQSSGYPDTDWLCAALKITLQKHEKPFVVAPFKAHAQLVFALQEGLVDALYGSSELFLYGAPKVITKINIERESSDTQSNEPNGQPESESNDEKQKIVWLELDQCLKHLGGDISFELFQNVLFITGTDGLKALAYHRYHNDQQVSSHFKDVVNSLSQMNGNVLHYCERFGPDIRGDWWDKYMRKYQAVKHMVIMFNYDTVKPRTYQMEEEAGRIPTDIHELIGLQLPAELHHYLFHGMIGPRVLNWLISGKIKLSAPLIGGENDTYRRLVREQLDPWRKQALALIAFTLSRYYQRKDFVTKIWYDAESDQKFNMGDLISDKRAISTWRVKQKDLNDQLKVVQEKTTHATLGSLQFALASVADTSFVPKTISSAQRSTSEAHLKSLEEITCNVLWRFLQIRGYINKEHELSEWGKVLLSAMKEIDDSAEQSESIFVVIELMRLGLLDKAEAFRKSEGSAPNSCSESDRNHCLFVSFIACTGRLIQEQQTYKGPLNSNHLAYHCLITEIKLALRDLIDMILATMFLDDEVERDRGEHPDYLKIAAALPFRDHWPVSLGNLSTLFLNELAATGITNNGQPHGGNSNKPDEIVTKIVDDWMPRTNVKDSLILIGRLWDAFITAAKSAPPGLVSNESKKDWLETDEWYRKYHAYIQ